MATLQEQARALGDPTRHGIFRYVADADSPVGVAELTDHLKLNHNAIRQHLAKLVEAGLVRETSERSKGPGRPRLLYVVAPGADGRWGVTSPYERLAVLLTEALRSGRTPREVGREAGHTMRTPHPSGDPVDDLSAAMDRNGFEPEVHRRDAGAEIVLHACPFAAAAQTDPDTVCDMHLGLAEGVSDGTDAVVDGLQRSDPHKAGCRFHVHVEPGS